MRCPHCGSATTQEQGKQTSLGYRTFCCIASQRRYNERSGTSFNNLSVPTDIAFLVVLWRLRYPLGIVTLPGQEKAEDTSGRALLQ